MVTKPLLRPDLGGGYVRGGEDVKTSGQKFEAAGLMAGAGPTATRAMALNFGMLAFNASAKVFR